MVKFLAFLLCFVCFLEADVAKSVVALSINEQKASEISTKNFINANGAINVVAITNELKSKNIFDARSFSSSSLNLDFFTEDEISATLFIKALNFSINSMGGIVANINKFANSNGLTYGVTVVKRDGIDPVLLDENLKLSGFKTLGFDRKDGALLVLLNGKNLNIPAGIAQINENNELILERLSSAFFLNTNGANSVSITSLAPNRWMPDIRIYDKNLVQISHFQEYAIAQKYEITLPSNASYMLLGDSVDISNIKKEIVIKFIK
ncbi:hypothetical protein CCAL_0159 [Campylobacter californiensis]|nr:hypothetical protein CCAL_0159 [Campylobacter sp. RM6914]